MTTLGHEAAGAAATPDAALAIMWDLARQAWAMSGRPFPTYTRATMPGVLIRPSLDGTPEP